MTKHSLVFRGPHTHQHQIVSQGQMLYSRKPSCLSSSTEKNGIKGSDLGKFRAVSVSIGNI